MAAPLRKGRALATQRLSGVAFLIVIAMLVWLSVALYNKDFTKTVDVSLQTNRVGNQLSVHADVKVRGLVVGEVRKISGNGDQAVLKLAIKPGEADRIPRNVQAQLLPKTLFGEKEVDLIISTTDTTADHLRNGDIIKQDQSTTALETEKALNDLLPLLQALKPQDLSMALNALATAVRDRGDKLGSTLVQQAAYFRTLNPSLPTLQKDMQGLADLANTYADAAPNILATLDNLAFSSRSIVEQQSQLDAFLKGSSDFAAIARRVTSENEQQFVDLARISRPVLDLYAKYSPLYPCTLHTIVVQQVETERTEGGLQGGLHITLEAIKDRNGGYDATTTPKDKETRDNQCFGLGSKRVIPYPNFANPQDGYKDSDPAENPHQGPGGCCDKAMSQFLTEPTPTAHRSMPKGMTELEMLLIAPASG